MRLGIGVELDLAAIIGLVLELDLSAFDVRLARELELVPSDRELLDLLRRSDASGKLGRVNQSLLLAAVEELLLLRELFTLFRMLEPECRRLLLLERRSLELDRLARSVEEERLELVLLGLRLLLRRRTRPALRERRGRTGLGANRTTRETVGRGTAWIEKTTESCGWCGTRRRAA